MSKGLNNNNLFNFMKIFLGSDHRGFALKEQVKNWLISSEHDAVDCGNTIHDPDDDFPDYAFLVSDKVISEIGSLGILVCGSGGGMTIAANKVKGIRAAEATNVNNVIHNRSHNNINILVLSADDTNFSNCRMMIESFLDTEYSPEARFERRIAKISSREK
jgi:RpiB/LacA/LacB family sugar-phosphate isomerase